MEERGDSVTGFEPTRFGKYQLVERIATGGMAEVYKAKSYGVMGFEKLLVIKKILPRLSRNREFIQMFVNEAKIAVSLNHANIAQVYDLGKVDGDYYMAMEYIHGMDLMRIMRRAKAKARDFPPSLGVFIVSEMARGLDYAHHLRDPAGRPLLVVHRDISPHNMILSYEGDVKLLDFGIARMGRDLEAGAKPAGGEQRPDGEEQKPAGGEQKLAGGKFGYMSPEHIDGTPIDHRSDIFSTGIILWELITGERLFAGKDRDERQDLIRRAEVPRPREVNPRVHPELERIVLRALSREPEERYQRAGDLHESLLTWLYDSGARVARADLAGFIQDLFSEEFRKDTAGSVLNALVQDINLIDENEAPPGPAPTPPSVREEASMSSRSASTETPGLGMGRMMEGERRMVYTLAVDVVGIAEMARHVGDDDQVRLTFAFLKRLARVVKRYRGTIDRFYNDRMVIFWGMRHAREGDLELTLRCADELRRFSQRVAGGGKARLHLCMGVHKGPVIVGKDRGRRVPHYTARGDTCRLANLLADQAELDQVLVSEEVMGLAAELAEFEALPPLPLKGSAGPSRPYRLLGVGQGAQRRPRGRWIKREAEFDALKDVVARVASGHSMALVVEGDAGSGKSRFLHEIRELTRDKGIGFYSGRASFFQREVPLLPFRDLLEQVCGFEAEDSADDRRRKLLRLSELNLAPLDIHLIGQIFDISFADSNLRYLSGDQRQLGIFQAVRRVLSGLSRDSFLFVTLENIQWMDRLSMDLVAHLLERLKDSRILFAFTVRSGDPLPFLEDGERVRRIALGPMTQEEVTAFAMDFLQVETVPEALTDLVYRGSGGNALFVKELLKTLSRTGVVSVHEGRVSVRGNLDRVAVPGTVRDLIASRIDDLGRTERVVLEVASVVGRAFSREMLEEVTRLGETLPSILARLKAADLVREGEAGEASYVFRNNLTWEVTYEGILAARRREFHNRSAEAIERLSADNLRPHYEALSVHYQKGGLLNRAASFAEQAAAAYTRESYHREAIRCYQRAILLLRGVEEAGDEALRRGSEHLAELYLRLGRLHITLGDLKEAERQLQISLDYAGDAEADAIEARALLGLGEVSGLLGKHPLAGTYLERAREQALSLGEQALAFDVDEELACHLMGRGEMEKTELVLERALMGSRSLSDPTREARIQSRYGDFFARKGNAEAARDRYLLALDLLQAGEEKVLMGRILNNLGVTLMHLQQFQEALKCYEDAYRLRWGMEYQRGMIINLHNIGDVYFRMGELPKAVRQFTESLRLAEENGWEGGRAINLIYLGFVDALQGSEERGTAQLLEGEALARQVGDEEAAATARLFLARLHAHCGHHQQAVEASMEARILAESVTATRLVKEIDEFKARLLALLNSSDPSRP